MTVRSPELNEITELADHTVQRVADALVWVVFRVSGVRS